MLNLTFTEGEIQLLQEQDNNAEYEALRNHEFQENRLKNAILKRRCNMLLKSIEGFIDDSLNVKSDIDDLTKLLIRNVCTDLGEALIVIDSSFKGFLGECVEAQIHLLDHQKWVVEMEHIYKKLSSVNIQNSPVSPIPPPNTSQLTGVQLDPSILTYLKLSSSIKLPELTIEPFDGRIDTYKNFKDSFQHLTAELQLTGHFKVRYLREHLLKGQALERVKHITSNDEFSLREIWETLDKYYGNSQAAEHIYSSRLYQLNHLFEPCKTDDDLKLVYDHVYEYSTKLRQITNDNSRGEDIKIILHTKLTPRLQHMATKLRNDNPDDYTLRNLLALIREHLDHNENNALYSEKCIPESKVPIVDHSVQVDTSCPTCGCVKFPKSSGNFTSPPLNTTVQCLKTTPIVSKTYSNICRSVKNRGYGSFKHIRSPKISLGNNLHDSIPPLSSKLTSFTKAIYSPKPSEGWDPKVFVDPDPLVNTLQLKSVQNPIVESKFSHVPSRLLEFSNLVSQPPPLNNLVCNAHSSTVCCFCDSKSHNSHHCTNSRSPNLFINSCKQLGLCKNCLIPGHVAKYCPQVSLCDRGCSFNQKHSRVVCPLKFTPTSCRVFVGGLPQNMQENHFIFQNCINSLDRAFSDYGLLRGIYVSKQFGYGFVIFDSPQEALTAIRNLDGQIINGMRCNVEVSRAKGRNEFQGSNRKSCSVDECWNCGNLGHLKRICNVQTLNSHNTWR